MTKSQTIGARFGLAILGASTMLAAAPGWAQGGAGYTESPAAALSRNLNSLAANPRSLAPLMGAGRAALELGDAQAALTFFGRAQEIAPQDGRIKMWIGSALAHLQQAQGAQKFFAEALSLGVPEADLAGERGLAFDIAGDPRSAQRDYRLSLQRNRDPEITRRLALSLAISGERDSALRLLDEQLRARDHDAERTRILILALTGDSTGAVNAVQASMPHGRGSAMAPFLQRLTLLNPAERAAAVHLGIFPQSGRSAGPVPNTFASANPVQAGTPDPRQAGLGGMATLRRDDKVQTAGVAAPRMPTTSAAAAPQSPQQRPSWAFTARSLSQMPAPKSPGIELKSGGASAGTLAPPVRVASNIAAAPAPAAQTPPPAANQARAPAGSAPVQFANSGTAGQPTQRAAAPSINSASIQPAPILAPADAQLAQSTVLNPAPKAFVPVAPQPAQASTGTIPVQQSQASITAPPTPTAATQQPIQSAARETAPSPGFSLLQPAASRPMELASADVPRTAPATTPEPAPGVEETSRTSRLADVAATIASLPDLAPPAVTAPKPAPVREPKAAPKPAAPKPEKLAVLTKPAAKKDDKAATKDPAAKGPAAKKPAEAAAKKPAAEPARVWVQVAGGANKTTLPKEYERLQAKAPKLLAARSAWTAPLKATNRLLVGPFKTEKEAQAFVNELAKSKLSGFAWSSEAGQKVEKLSAR
ncbi:SPOR domain-containing protein [Sphingosinicella sp. BN140058]|uniref:SPOR domain-containing protein n=1 Tax=Sphingosinicella sp. BN140058 TaxID=1892855 RepID=UPI00101167CE|nr:SPOR domain-containing protein [Sphingosinicella sp. BN140058]QAY77770.1 SPOR domain-containing protein [Sphingosinicella sp. BN140058]